MNDIELDTMIERDAERQWEELTQPAPSNPIETIKDDDRISAYSKLNTASFMMMLAMEDVDKTIEIIKDTPQGDKLVGLYDQFCDLIHDMKAVEEEVWKKHG